MQVATPGELPMEHPSQAAHTPAGWTSVSRNQQPTAALDWGARSWNKLGAQQLEDWGRKGIWFLKATFASPSARSCTAAVVSRHLLRLLVCLQRCLPTTPASGAETTVAVAELAFGQRRNYSHKSNTAVAISKQTNDISRHTCHTR